jgi:TRAP transporter TAXI family solute receptor
MIRKTSLLVRFLPVVALLLMLPLQGHAAEAQKGDVSLVIGGFFPGTSLHLRAQAIGAAIRRDFPDWKLTVTSATSAKENEVEYLKGKRDLFVTTSTWKAEVAVMSKGVPDYAKRLDAMSVMPTCMKTHQFLVNANTGLNSLNDIRLKKFPLRVGMTTKGDTNYYSNEIMFGAYGITIEDIEKWGGNIQSAADMTPSTNTFKMGKLDAIFKNAGVPQPQFLELSEIRTLKMKLLPLGEEPEVLKVAREKLDLDLGVLKAGTYPFMDKDVTTLVFPEMLMASPRVPEAVVYSIMKTLWEKREYLFNSHASFREGIETPELLMKNLKIYGRPIHPGAERFFKEKGWLK